MSEYLNISIHRNNLGRVFTQPLPIAEALLGAPARFVMIQYKSVGSPNLLKYHCSFF
jgi:hypothetical protein